jgi:aminoglycoside phosphotransferase (APT) family kinase protein
MTLADHLSHYLVGRYPDAIVSNIHFLMSGFESEIYTFHLQLSHSSQQDYVLRLFTGKGASEKLNREARGLSLLQKAGYPVPALLLQETETRILGKPFEIIDKLEGLPLWPLLASAESHREGQLLARFGLLLAQLHKLEWRLFTRNPDAYEKNPILLLDETISQYRSLYTKYSLKGFIQIIDWLDIHKYEISVQPAVVHQDFHANNILLCSNDQLFVIDWTQFAISDYRIDLAWTLLLMGDLGNVHWGKQIFEAYASDSNHSIKHLDYFNVIVYMKLLASTVISFMFGPQELGLRPEALELKQQLPIYKQLSQRIRNITGLTVPELQDVLERI